jgi:hypothetical protein
MLQEEPLKMGIYHYSVTITLLTSLHFHIVILERIKNMSICLTITDICIMGWCFSQALMKMLLVEIKIYTALLCTTQYRSAH